MDRDYDIFERIDGQLVWRAVISGHKLSIHKLTELSVTSQNEFVVLHMPTKAVIAVVNSRK